ncbi:MAG: hypothetical protein ACYS30_15895 [Planctomycetota bacterium]|jgi:hypothetical protein
MNIKQRKAKKFGCVVAGLGALIQSYAAIIFGIREEWFRFGLFLSGCIIAVVFFTGIIVQLGIDIRFNHLEQLINELREKKPKNEQEQ